VERAKVCAMLRAVFAEDDPALAREPCCLACERIGADHAACTRPPGEAEPSALAYLDFPAAHRRRLRTNNVQERLNREIKRRTKVVQMFPSRESLIRLVSALLEDVDAEWKDRHWFSEASMALLEDMGSEAAAEPRDYPEGIRHRGKS
jgi:transposase-like protein